MIITFGILGPWIAVHYSWRWLYFITSGFGIVAWVLLLVYVPESRKARSKEELGKNSRSRLVYLLDVF